MVAALLFAVLVVAAEPEVIRGPEVIRLDGAFIMSCTQDVQKQNYRFEMKYPVVIDQGVFGKGKQYEWISVYFADFKTAKQIAEAREINPNIILNIKGQVKERQRTGRPDGKPTLLVEAELIPVQKPKR